MLECQVDVPQAAGEFWLELSRGPDRFQARCDLPAGQCTLVRLTGTNETTLARQPIALAGGKHEVRFANFDSRLTLWIDGQLPFGDGVDYERSTEPGPVAEHDLAPARLGARGAAVQVSALKLWRDTYYTTGEFGGGVDFRDPDTWQPLRQPAVRTYHVAAGHYFFLGDNSSSSSDSRFWGLVPAANLIGPAAMIYLPWERRGQIH